MPRWEKMAYVDRQTRPTIRTDRTFERFPAHLEDRGALSSASCEIGAARLSKFSELITNKLPLSRKTSTCQPASNPNLGVQAWRGVSEGLGNFLSESLRHASDAFAHEHFHDRHLVLCLLHKIDCSYCLLHESILHHLA